MKKLRLALLSTIVVSTILGSMFAVGLLRPAAAPPAAATFDYRAKWICNIPDANGLVQQSAAESKSSPSTKREEDLELLLTPHLT